MTRDLENQQMRGRNLVEAPTYRSIKEKDLGEGSCLPRFVPAFWILMIVNCL